MKEFYRSFILAESHRFLSRKVLLLGLLINLTVAASGWARSDEHSKGAVTLPSASLSIKSPCTPPTFGSLSIPPGELYQGNPVSFTSIITGLIPNATQTFTYTIDGIVQPLVTGTSDADGNMINPLSALVNLDASLQPVGDHVVAITQITYNGCSLTPTSNNAVTITVKPAPDLTPVIHAGPSTLYGSTPISVVVDVFEVNGSPTNHPIKVLVNKPMQVSLSLTSGATMVGGRSVQNTDWTFNESEDPDFYILTTNKVISPGAKLSFGLEGTLMPGETSGTLPIITVVVPQTGGELIIVNNTDSDKINYFAH